MSWGVFDSTRQHYVVEYMQKVEGKTLNQLEAEQVNATLIHAVLDAYVNLQIVGVLQNDLKASNVVINEHTNRVCIIDYGTSKPNLTNKVELKNLWLNAKILSESILGANSENNWMLAEQEAVSHLIRADIDMRQYHAVGEYYTVSVFDLILRTMSR